MAEQHPNYWSLSDDLVLVSLGLGRFIQERELDIIAANFQQKPSVAFILGRLSLLRRERDFRRRALNLSPARAGVGLGGPLIGPRGDWITHPEESTESPSSPTSAEAPTISISTDTAIQNANTTPRSGPSQANSSSRSGKNNVVSPSSASSASPANAQRTTGSNTTSGIRQGVRQLFFDLTGPMEIDAVVPVAEIVLEQEESDETGSLMSVDEVEKQMDAFQEAVARRDPGGGNQ